MIKNSPVLIGLVLLVCGLTLTGCERTSSELPQDVNTAEAVEAADSVAEEAKRTETERLNAFLDQIYERNVAAQPERETALGRKTDIRMPGQPAICN